MLKLPCCRTCLKKDNLNPIFFEPNQDEKYIAIIQLVTGVTIKKNDELPKHMCTECIVFINKSLGFRNNCAEANHKLQETFIYKQTLHNSFVKEENFKNFACIQIHAFQENLIDKYVKKERIYSKPEMLIEEDDNYNMEISMEPLDDIMKLEDDIILDNVQTKRKSARQIAKNNMEPSNILIVKPPKERKAIRRKRQNNVESETCNVEKKDIETAKEKKKKERFRDVLKRMNVKTVECDICHKAVSKSYFRAHYKAHTGYDYVCEHCGKSFINRKLLLVHCRAKHGYEKTDKCSYCDYTGTNSEQVRIHERLHTGEKPFSCKECSASFHRRSNYIQHKAIHLPEKNFQCDQCPALFKSLRFMRIHKNRSHRARKYTYKCGYCGNQFVRRWNVVLHVKRMHGGQPPSVERLRIENVVDRVRLLTD